MSPEGGDSSRVVAARKEPELIKCQATSGKMKKWKGRGEPRTEPVKRQVSTRRRPQGMDFAELTSMCHLCQYSLKNKKKKNVHLVSPNSSKNPSAPDLHGSPGTSSRRSPARHRSIPPCETPCDSHREAKNVPRSCSAQGGTPLPAKRTLSAAPGRGGRPVVMLRCSTH